MRVHALKSFTPAIALVLSLGLTIGAAFFAYSSSEAENQARFDRAAGNFLNALKNRMNVYLNSLIYTRDLLDLKPDLTLAEFRDFVKGMRLRESVPGIQTLGYVERVNLPGARRALRKLGLTAGAVGLDQRRNEFDLVVMVERLYDRSATVLGFDLGTSRERKNAMNLARDLGEPVATERVLPMQKGAERDYAFLVFVPRYRKGAPIATLEQRRRALVGFLYGGFRASNLFGRVSDLMRFRTTGFLIEIFDGTDHSPDRLMYAEGDPRSANYSLQRDLDLEFARHRWSVRITAPEGFSIPSLRFGPLLVLFVGLLFSSAIFWILRRSEYLTEKLHDANRAKSIFLANISHEIRTPLGAMIGFAELALVQDKKEERDRSLATIVRNGRQLTRIIGDVLDLSKIEAKSLVIEPSPFKPASMISDVIAEWKPQVTAKGLAFELDVDPSLPERILSDEARIKQILTNLLSNAVKFTDEGFIRLSVGRAIDADGVARLRFALEDSGVGISDDLKYRLFVPFSQGDSSVTRRVGGSGLGLALSRQLAEALGGGLELEKSGTRRGSRFTLTLPLIEAAPKKEARAAPEPDARSLGGRRILLVEDSEDNQALISILLERAGARVDVAGNGREGVDKALAGNYDLVLMDIQMPVLDGHAALAELQARDYRVPVVALTAHALSDERDRALTFGFADYLTKPIDRALLIRVAARLATRARAAAAKPPPEAQV